MKKLVSWLLVVIMVATLLPASIFAAGSDTTLSVTSATAAPGETVTVDVMVENNPGILGATLQISYDEGLTLVDAKAGEAFSHLTMTKPGAFASPCQFVWDGQECNPEDVRNGVVLTLTFLVAEGIADDTSLSVDISVPNDDLVDNNLNMIVATTNNGTIKVASYLPGDVNSDGKVGSADIITLRRYIAGGYDVEVNKNACNVNADGKISSADVIIIRRYLAGGYGVTPLPDDGSCVHSMEATEYLAPTCTEEGNIAYWHCTKCDKYFSDEVGIHAVAKDATVLAATGHTVIIDPYVEPTETTTGLTEGSHCGVCQKVLVAQAEIPVLQNENAIVYYLNPKQDEYLASVEIENPNPSTYSSDSSLRLQEPMLAGYTFEGWYDGQGSSAKQIKVIEKGESGKIYLYARWEPIVYTITFESNSLPCDITAQTYTVNKNTMLRTPICNGYVFLGWTNIDNELTSAIPAGTTGDITLHANWTSKRNLARPVSKLGDPIICEDSDNGTILFAYEIGQIENVPLKTIESFAYAPGVDQIVTKTYTKEITKQNATTVANTISNSTTNSTHWGLTEDWNEVTRVSESWLQQEGITREEGESIAKTKSDTYTFSREDFDSTVVKTNEGTCATTTKYGKTTGESGSDKTHGYTAGGSLEVSGKLTYEANAGVKKEVAGNGVEAGGKIGYEIGGKAEGHYDYDNHTTDYGKVSTDSGKDVVIVDDNTKITTTDSGWKTISGNSNSSSVSTTKSVQTALSSLISQTKNYGTEYSAGGEKSADAEWASSNSSSNQFSSEVTYINSTKETKTTEFHVSGRDDGYYRLVMAGTMHVFGVVGYDVATASYFVFTYNVMDDETYEWVDYSRTTANYNDNENGVLPFNVPFEVYEYVTGRTAYTNGLKFDASTGMVTYYTGDSKEVIIPEYISVDNKDGTYSAVKITGISENAFKVNTAGNTYIEEVYLSKYIDKIPDFAFAGCTNLKAVYGADVTSTGEGAFSGCTSLDSFLLPNTVTYLGQNAFVGVPEVSVNAATPAIAQNTIKSGAKKITLNISEIAEETRGATLTVGAVIDYFELQGGRNTFSDLRIQSYASTTVLNGLTITQCTRIPLEISSQKLSLRQVAVDSSNYALLLKNDADVEIYGTNFLTSANGKAAVCGNINLERMDSPIACTLNVFGNIYVCGDVGDVTDNGTLTVTNGSIIKISESEYAKYIKGLFTVSFDANGGTMENQTVEVCYGSAIGKLPTPQKDYYDFVGWFTGPVAGTLVDENWISSDANDCTLYAHWEEKPVSDWALESDLPEDAVVVNEKWTYTKTTTAESEKSTMNGFELVNTTWSGYGNWSSWQNSSVSSSDSRKVETRSVATYKTQYNYSRYTQYSNGGGWNAPSEGTWSGYYCGYYFERGWTDSPLGLSSTDQGFAIYGSPGNYWYNQTTRSVQNGSYTQYRYCDRHLIYHFEKVENLESTSEVTATDTIGNVQHWVQYREK